MHCRPFSGARFDSSNNLLTINSSILWRQYNWSKSLPYLMHAITIHCAANMRGVHCWMVDSLANINSISSSSPPGDSSPLPLLLHPKDLYVWVSSAGISPSTLIILKQGPFYLGQSVNRDFCYSTWFYGNGLFYVKNNFYVDELQSVHVRAWRKTFQLSLQECIPHTTTIPIQAPLTDECVFA